MVALTKKIISSTLAFALVISSVPAMMTGALAEELSFSEKFDNVDTTHTSDATRLLSVKGSPQTLFQGENYSWELSGKVIGTLGAGATNNPGAWISNGELFIRDRWNYATAVNLKTIEKLPMENICEAKFSTVRVGGNDGQVGFRLAINGDENQYINFTHYRFSDKIPTDGRGGEPYVTVVKGGNAIAVSNPKVPQSASGREFNNGGSFNWTVKILGTKLIWNVSCGAASWEGSLVCSSLTDILKETEYPAAGFSKGDRYASIDNIEMKFITGEYYLNGIEPHSVLYRDLYKPERETDGVIKFDKPSAVRKIVDPALEYTTKTIEVSTDDESFSTIEAIFGSGGIWLNTETAEKYSAIKIDGHGDNLKILSDVTENDSFDVEQNSSTQLYARIFEQENGAEWSSSDDDKATIDNGIVTAKKDGNVVISATQDGTEIKTGIRIVGELTYAIENGTIDKYLTAKKEIVDVMNSAIKAKDKAALREFITGDTDKSLSHIYAIDSDAVRALSSDSSAFDRFLDKIMTYPEFDCAKVEDIYFLEKVLNNELAVTKADNAADKEALMTVLNDNNAVYSLDLENKYFISEKDSVLSEMINTVFKNLDDLQGLFKKLYTINNLKSAETVAYCKKLVTDCADEIGYDTTIFEKYENDIGLFEKIYSNKDRINTLSELKNVVESYEPAPTGGGGGGGGAPSGGGSVSLGGGSTSTLSVPIITTPAVKSTEPAVAAVQLYSDVPTTHWAYEPIRFLTALNAASGENGRFNPNNEITRAEFLKLLMAGMKLESKQPENDEQIFNDVAAEDWFALYFAAAKELGIILGDNNGMAMPENKITRQEMAVMVYRTIEKAGRILQKGQLSTPFEDRNTIAPWAFSAVSKMQLAGILSGDGNRFYPENNSTRAEAAKVICVAIEKSEVAE